jgi:membrane protein YdbS with pleckstrin-like domain
MFVSSNRRTSMIDLNRVVSYLTISLILLFGIAVVSGILGDFEWKWRLGIGIIVGLYAVVRLWLMSFRSRPRPMKKYGEKAEDD